MLARRWHLWRNTPMRKHCNRKHYARVNPITMAIDGAAITPSSQLDELRVRELASIEAFRTGDATLQEWADISNMSNLCQTLALAGVGPEALEAVEVCERELIGLAKRYEKTRRFTLTATGLQAMRDVFEYHDLQRQSISRGEYERHITKLHNRMRSKAKGVTVL